MLKKICFEKVLIIKTGQYETFTNDCGASISLGDVFRTTCLLSLQNIFSNSISFHWFTSPAAMPLFQNTHLVKADIFDKELIENILQNNSCLVINLERSHDLQNSDLLFRINNNKKHKLIGFIFDKDGWKLKDTKNQYWSLVAWLDYCQTQGNSSWGEMLSNLIGFDIPTKHGIAFADQQNKTSDVGLNWMCSNKWPGKSIDISSWEMLAKILSSKYKISWQQGFNDLNEYINWISSNKILISLDSLGLHLATSMKIPVIGLFGNTISGQIDLNSNATFLSYETNSNVILPINKIVSCLDHLFNSTQNSIDLFQNVEIPKKGFLF